MKRKDWKNVGVGDGVVKLYSEAFELQVVREFEAGEYPSVEATRRNHGFVGTSTVGRWLKRYGRGQ